MSWCHGSYGLRKFQDEERAVVTVGRQKSIVKCLKKTFDTSVMQFMNSVV